MALEFSQYLENYLWPNFTPDRVRGGAEGVVCAHKFAASARFHTGSTGDYWGLLVYMYPCPSLYTHNWTHVCMLHSVVYTDLMESICFVK